MTYDPEAVAELVLAADHYPWFLQLYGREAFNAVQDAGGHHFGAAECQTVIEHALKPRLLCYDRLSSEFETDNNFQLARTVALHFKQGGGVLTRMQLHQMLTETDPERALEQATLLRHSGFIVERAEPGTWEPGIPSFMDYMIRTTEPASTVPQPASS